MSEDMVERVGRALAQACLDEFGSTWSNDVCWKFARAAIEAMRQPSVRMVKAAFDEALVPIFDAKAAWSAMIDAALSNSKPEER